MGLLTTLARIVLPKPLEYKFGITQKPGKSMVFPLVDDDAKMTLLGVNKEKKKQLIPEIQQDNDFKLSIKEDAKNYIKDLIKTGQYDKEEIKSSAKSFIKQKINNQILQKKFEKEPAWTAERALKQPMTYAKEVFDEDWGRQAGDIVKGLDALLGWTAKTTWNRAKHPIETIKKDYQTTKELLTSPEKRQEIWNNYIVPGATGVKEYIKEYKHPFQKLADSPLDVALDAQAVLSLGSTAAARAGLTKTSEALAKAATPLTLKNVSNTTKAIVKKLPNGEAIVKDWELASETQKFLNKEQSSFLNLRNRTINDIDKKVGALSKEEASLLPQIAEGFKAMPENASQELKDAFALMTKLADDQAQFGLTIGKLTPEQVERRRFQPLANWLAKEDKIPLIKKFDQLEGPELRNAIDAIKSFFPDADPVYMRHFFSDNPKAFGNFFLNVPVKTFKPGFLKKSYGVDGYMGQFGKITKAELTDVLERQATENLKWQRNMKLIEDLKSHPAVKELKSTKDLLPGYKVFSPDGLLRFYKGVINLSDELKKGLNISDDTLEALGKAINKVFPDDAEKTYLGVGKAKLYQAPEAMAKQLNAMTKATPDWLKIIHDKPQDAFRFFSLGLMPRWHTNNVVGNMIFSLVNGDILNPRAYWQAMQLRKQDKLPDFLLGGIHRSEASTAGRLGRAGESNLVRSTIELRDKLLNTKVVGKVLENIGNAVKWTVYKPVKAIGDKSFKAGQYVDDIFKGAAYINAALKEDRKGFIKRMLANFDDVEKSLAKLSDNPKLMESTIDKVHQWYYHNSNLTNFERRVVRRVLPFYSWMRWITEYSYRVATEAPIRARIISSFAENYYDMTGQDKLPSWLQGSTPIGNDEDGTVYYLKTSGMNPFSTINDLITGGVSEALLQGSAPVIKTIIERGQGKELFLGRKFTSKDLEESMSGQLFKFDPELGEVVFVDEKEKPALLEHLLRNYIPQYVLLETILTGGRERYTAEGLNTILSDLFKDKKDREAVVNDIITHQGMEKKKFWQETGKALGINIQEQTPQQRVAREKALETATSAILNKELPILNPSFKEMIKERVMQEIISGTPKAEIKQRVKEWISINVEELKKLK